MQRLSSLTFFDALPSNHLSTIFPTALPPFLRWQRLQCFSQAPLQQAGPFAGATRCSEIGLAFQERIDQFSGLKGRMACEDCRYRPRKSVFAEPKLRKSVRRPSLLPMVLLLAEMTNDIFRLDKRDVETWGGRKHRRSRSPS